MESSIQAIVGWTMAISLSLYLGSKYSFALVAAIWVLSFASALAAVTYF